MLERDVAEGVHRISHSYTNFYLIDDGDAMTLVDAGLPTSWRVFADAVASLGRRVRDVRALVLTHGHFDHIGFAERARSAMGVPVWVHPDDENLTRHPLQYEHERPRSLYFVTRPRALPIVFSLTRNRAWWPPPIKEVRYFDEGVLAVPGAPRVVATPGHTFGHCALHLSDRDCVIAGDSIVTLDPYTGLSGPRIVARAATADSERALRSLEALAATNARTVLTGHGEPWHRGVAEVVRLAKESKVA